MEISSVNFIRLYTKPEAATKNATIYIYRPSDRNRTCGPAIPVQRSNRATESTCRALRYTVHTT